MATKRICDFCGKEIVGRIFAVGVYDETRDKSVTERDSCGLCLHAINRAINSVVAKKV